MTRSSTYSIFSEPQPERRNSSGVAVSLVLHAIGFVWILLSLAHPPPVETEPHSLRYTVRVLQSPLEFPAHQQSAQAAAPGIGKPAPHRAPAPGGQLASLPFLSPKIAVLPPGPQTLIQPDVPPRISIPKPIPIPRVVVWSADNTKDMRLVPPPAQKVSVVAAHASIVSPNHETTPADIKISSTRFATDKLTLTPSTTSPIVVRSPEPAQQLPQTASRPGAEPTPARIVSLSDAQAKDSAVIPSANSSARKASSDSLAPGQSDTSSVAGSGNPASKQAGVGTGANPASHSDKADAGNGGNGGAAAIAQNGTGGSAGPGGVAPFGTGEPPLIHIHVPRDGQYGVVVVGSSLADKYPETVDLWSGRLIYTVYLHVGLKKNWILQYSLPHSADAASTSAASQPAAPWPFDIVRSSAAPDPDADAVLVHGFVTVAGRFEKLAVAFPASFAQADFLLHALQQWQFRPATQSGQPILVEVLLIIPNETE
jgi:hypothetical protein